MTPPPDFSDCEAIGPPSAGKSGGGVIRGLVLAGGGSLLRGLPELISRETDLPVHLTPQPLDCVVLGCGKFLEELERFDAVRKRMFLAT